MNPDQLAELEEERDHLLASIEDLEREHDAGDLDEVDYQALKDDYTARAAEVIRAIDEHRQLVRDSRPARSASRTFAVAAAVLAFAVLAGVLVARAAGQRGAGTLTGNDSGIRERLADCQPLAFQDPSAGVDCYQEILDESPDNVEALTYQGWALIRDDRVEEGAQRLDRAVELDPDYPDARAFRAVVAARAGEAASARGDREAATAAFKEAAAEIDRFYASDPPEVAVQVLQEELLEFKVFLGLLDEATRSCWSESLSARGDSAAFDQQLYDDLAACADAVLVADPNNTDALFTSGLARLGPERQDPAAASAAVERLLAVDPANPNGLLLRAALRLSENRTADALADLEALAGLIRPTASFLLGSPADLRELAAEIDQGPPSTASSGPGAPSTTASGAPSTTASGAPGATASGAPGATASGAAGATASGAAGATAPASPSTWSSVSTVPGSPGIPNASGER